MGVSKDSKEKKNQTAKLRRICSGTGIDFICFPILTGTVVCANGRKMPAKYRFCGEMLSAADGGVAAVVARAVGGGDVTDCKLEWEKNEKRRMWW